MALWGKYGYSRKSKYPTQSKLFFKPKSTVLPMNTVYVN